ncbi:unnamed protein product [Haemonchus placei]|uniref:Phlebovirus_G2 domain-containing protein n=1 Tax=Haemonchus placei TaxID=6290 RepID=A0A0N4W622_HAEPC|nr:unnamed protein product [Haemonchus placei]
MKAARGLYCTVNCVCQPAENKVNCVCYDPDIAGIFTKEVENRLPIVRYWITLKESDSNASSVLAVIPTFVTADVIIQLDDQIDKVKQ